MYHIIVIVSPHVSCCHYGATRNYQGSLTKGEITVRTTVPWRLSTVVGLALVPVSLLLIPGCGGQRGRAPQAESASQGKNGAGTQQAHVEKVSARQALGAHAKSTWLEFKTQPKQITAGQPTIWTLKIFDVASGEALRKFQAVNDQYIHLVVVSRDLSWFAHVRPEYKDRGLFIATVTLPRAGEYKLYADYTLRDGSREVAQREVRAVAGSDNDAITTSTKTSPPTVDKIGQNGWIVKRTIAVPEGESGEPLAQDGPSYEVALMPTPAKLQVGRNVNLHFQLRDAQGEPIKELQPYLGAMGHVVILSADTEIYLHADPAEGQTEDGNGGPDVMFRTRFPTPGLYKVWAKFMHNDKVITAPFVVKVEGTAPAQ